ALADEALAFESREQTVDGALVEVHLAADLRDAHLRGVIAERLEHCNGATHRLVPRHDALTALAPLLVDALCRRILSHVNLSFLSGLFVRSRLRRRSRCSRPSRHRFMPSSHHGGYKIAT